jgi:hypothetical protein
MIRRTAAGVFILLFVATSVHFAAAQDTARWKRYRNSEYVFEIAYPPDWLSHASERARPPRQLGPDGWRQRFFLPEVLSAHAVQFQVAKVS